MNLVKLSNEWSINVSFGPSTASSREGSSKLSTSARRTGFASSRSNTIQNPAEFITENEKHHLSVASSKRRPESLRPTPFSPLRVIAEREGEQSNSSLQIMDIEGEEQETSPTTEKQPAPQKQQQQQQQLKKQPSVEVVSRSRSHSGSSSGSRSASATRETGV